MEMPNDSYPIVMSLYVVPMNLPDTFKQDYLLGDIGITPAVNATLSFWDSAKSFPSLQPDLQVNKSWRWPSDLMGQGIKLSNGQWYSSFEVHRHGYALIVDKDKIPKIHNHVRIEYDMKDTAVYRPKTNVTTDFVSEYKIYSNGRELDADWRKLAPASQLYIESLIPDMYYKPLYVYCYTGGTGY